MERPTRLVSMNQLGAALTELGDPPIMSLYVYHSNPASVTPDQNAVIKGLERSDLFTVVHERFLTDTARLRDLRQRKQARLGFLSHASCLDIEHLFCYTAVIHPDFQTPST